MLPFFRGAGADVTRLRSLLGAPAFFGGVSTGQVVRAAVPTSGLAINAVSFPASNLFSGSFVVDGTVHAFDTWLTPANTSIAIAVNAQGDIIYVHSAIDLTFSNLKDNDQIQDRLIDDLNNVYMNPSNTLVSGIATLQSTIQGLPGVDTPALPADTYPKTRTYTLQVNVHSAGAAHSLSVTFSKIKIWGWDQRR